MDGAEKLLEVEALEHLEDSILVQEKVVIGHPVPQHVDLGLFADQLGPEPELEHRRGEAAVLSATEVLVLLVHVEFVLKIILVHCPMEHQFYEGISCLVKTKHSIFLL